MEFRLPAERLGNKEFRMKAELHAGTPCFYSMLVLNACIDCFEI